MAKPWSHMQTNALRDELFEQFSSVDKAFANAGNKRTVKFRGYPEASFLLDDNCS